MSVRVAGTLLPCDAMAAPCAEMGLHGGDVWGHIAPMFHLVDVFAVYAVTFLGGRHVTLPAFSPGATLELIGTPQTLNPKP